MDELNAGENSDEVNEIHDNQLTEGDYGPDKDKLETVEDDGNSEI